MIEKGNVILHIVLLEANHSKNRHKKRALKSFLVSKDYFTWHIEFFLSQKLDNTDTKYVHSCMRMALSSSICTLPEKQIQLMLWQRLKWKRRDIRNNNYIFITNQENRNLWLISLTTRKNNKKENHNSRSVLVGLLTEWAIFWKGLYSRGQFLVRIASFTFVDQKVQVLQGNVILYHK